MSFLTFTKKLKRKSDSTKPAKPVAKAKVDTAEKEDKLVPATYTGGRVLDLQPVVSEKSVSLQEHNVATFRAPSWASRGQIALAVETRYKTPVLKVRVVKMHAKRRRRGATSGWTAGWKKAYVTVKDVQSLVTGP